ncbi:hypothetical protein ACFL3S_09805 [Gemmatimonadota bacterium]
MNFEFRITQPGLLMRSLLLFALPALLTGCTTTRVITTDEMAAVAPALSIERFLQAANARDLHGMARIFGTPDGPAIETGGTFGCAFKKLGSWFGMGERCQTLQEVEVRMDAIARILAHEDYSIASEAEVPGRVNPTTRIGVHMRVQGQEVSDVPFIVVRTDEGRWLIEEIGLDRITGR